MLSLTAPNNAREVLLHSCCAPCSAAVVECMTASGIRPTVFFFNPNIYPREEYERRKAEALRYVTSLGLPFVDADYDYGAWREKVREFYGEPERGRRCSLCFSIRLEAAARYASEHGFRVFATTLASSRWKDINQVNLAGRRAAEKYESLVFWEQNWRKGGLQERRSALLKENNFYNQLYCGCEFSLLSSRNPCREQEPPAL